MLEKIKTTKLRRDLSRVLEGIHQDNKSYELVLYKRPVAYIISPEDFMILNATKIEEEDAL